MPFNNDLFLSIAGRQMVWYVYHELILKIQHLQIFFFNPALVFGIPNEVSLADLF